jgi:hypothetical protein
MEGLVRLALAREPDATLAAGIEGTRHATALLREEPGGKVLGMGSRSVRRVFYRGEPALLGYLGQLRVKSGLCALKRLRAGFENLERTRREDELPFDLTSIVEDNSPARRLLERGLPRFPRYQPLTRLTTCLISTAGSRTAGDSSMSARDPELAEIAECLQRNLRRYEFAPIWTEEELRSNEICRDLRPEDFLVKRVAGRITGCAAIWDQRGFKQVIVAGYAPWLARCRPVVNVGLALTRRPRLPSPSSTLSVAYLSHVAIDADCAQDFLELVAAARVRAARRGIDFLALGFAQDHPLLEVALSKLRPRSYRSILYLVHPATSGCPDAVERGCRPHVEVATL